MKPTTDINGKIGPILELFKNIFYLSKLFIKDDFYQTINVTVSMSDPSSLLKAQIYDRQRLIHCQKQVSSNR